MKYIILLTSLFYIHSANAVELGMCLADTGSKRYIQNDTGLEYPKHFIFECTYECGIESGIKRIKGVSDITVGRKGASDRDNRAAEAMAVVCQGVKVKKVSWGHDFDGVDAFYVYDTRIPELKKWAEENISRDNPVEIEKLNKLKTLLNEVAFAYLTAGQSNSAFKYFEDAGLELLNIASELPYLTDRLDIHLNKLKASQGDIGNINTADGLILSQLKVQASWRLPIMR